MAAQNSVELPNLAWKIMEKLTFYGTGKIFHFLSAEFQFLNVEFQFLECIFFFRIFQARSFRQSVQRTVAFLCVQNSHNFNIGVNLRYLSA